MNSSSLSERAGLAQYIETTLTRLLTLFHLVSQHVCYLIGGGTRGVPKTGWRMTNINIADNLHVSPIWTIERNQ